MRTHLPSERLLPALTLSLLLSFLVSACGGDEPAPQAPPSVAENEAIAADQPEVILSALISAWGEADADDEEPIVILLAGKTRANRQFLGDSATQARASLLEMLDDVRTDTIDDFIRASGESMDLRDVLTSPHVLHFVAPEEFEVKLAGQLSPRETDAHYRRIIGSAPGARVIRSVSLPGVSADGRQALIYASEEMRSQISTGYYFLLARDEGRWGMVAKVTAWIS